MTQHPGNYVFPTWFESCNLPAGSYMPVMMGKPTMRTIEELTERELQGLEHRRKAQALGMSLKEYARKVGLDVQRLYQLRPLVRRGALFSRARLPQEHSTHSFYSSPLKEWRKRNHVTQAQLALRCEVHPSVISQLESRRMVPSLALVHRLSRVTGMSLERLTLFFLFGGATE